MSRISRHQFIERPAVSDGVVFANTVKGLSKKVVKQPRRVTFWNDLSTDKCRRRLKAQGIRPSSKQLAKYRSAFMKAYGDRFIECGVTKKWVIGWMTGGGDLFVRVATY